MFSVEEMLVKRLARKTGFAVTVGSVKANPFTGKLHLKEIEITNPQNFPVTPFLSIAEITGQILPGTFFGQRIHVRDLAVHVRRLTGVRAQDGAVNIEQFREALERRESDHQQDKRGKREVFIQRLALRIDHVATMDFSSERADGNRDYPILFEREFRDVSDLISLGPPLVEHCDVAGLSLAADSIFATLLPEVLWRRIGSLTVPGTA